MQPKRSESGQALILIVFGIIGLLGLAGLALDAGNAFADRRQAQNAVDSAALSAAIAQSRNQNFRDAARSLIEKNGYLLDGNSTIEINQPPVDGPYSCQNKPQTCQSFIQVKLTSHINTMFATIVGVNSLTNQVSAVAQTNASVREPFYGGSAVVALNKTNCKALEFSGNNHTKIEGSGIYVNSGCNTQTANSPQQAFYSGGSSDVSVPWIKVVGGAYYAPGTLDLETPIATGALSLPDIRDSYSLPAPECGQNGQIDPEHPNIALPGNYADFPPNGVDTMAEGVFCLGNLKPNGDLHGENILIVLSGGVKLEGNYSVILKGRTQGEYAGLLMYMPPSHQQPITINGSSDSEFSGLILAPGSHITINGTGKVGHFKSQIIADTVTFSGNSDMVIDYDRDSNYQPYTHARVELVR
jgi:hypothetical protein